MAALLASFSQNATGSEPFAPREDSAVVETLRTSPLAPADRSLRQLRERHSASPTNLTIAIELTQALIRKGRAEADSRSIAQALATLTPWLANSAPPASVRVLRATIRQSLHDFDGALADLDAALRLDPQNLQAWLTKATVHTVRAEYPLARQACLRLTRLADELTAVTATAQVASLTGSARSSYDLLKATVKKERKSGRPVPVDTLVWAYTLLGEIAARLGDSDAAEREFRSALLSAPEDPYLLGAFADFLLDETRHDDVIDLLAKYSRIDSLLLRIAEARAASALPNQSTLSAQVRELTARFDAARLRGDSVHRREEARFRLHLLHDAPGALQLARQNWRVQKEPADARLLLESARAANDPEALREITTWIQSTKVEDRALAF